MRLSLAELGKFWAAAEPAIPLLIAGAGRWGRTLAGVAALARGGSDNLALVARSNLDATRQWCAANPLLGSLVVSADLATAVRQLRMRADRPPVAIVASRPRAHIADARSCIEAGLPTMVEVPLASDPQDAARIVQIASAAGRFLALAVEFSVMPAFHYLADHLAMPRFRARMDWSDPVNEERHGQTKRVHEEINVLESILPHVASIGRIFLQQGSRWTLHTASVEARGDRGNAVLTCAGSELVLDANRVGTHRTRRLRLESSTGCVADVDFSAPRSVLQIDGQQSTVPEEWVRLDSNLRLELGAFFLGAEGRVPGTPLSDDLVAYAHLHQALRDALG